ASLETYPLTPTSARPDAPGSPREDSLSFTLRRRRFFGAAGGFALAPSLAPAPASAATPDWPLVEGKDTPKLCLGTGRSGDPKEMRRFKQIGIDHVLMGGPKIPWTEADLKAHVENYRA